MTVCVEAALASGTSNSQHVGRNTPSSQPYFGLIPTLKRPTPDALSRYKMDTGSDAMTDGEMWGITKRNKEMEKTEGAMEKWMWKLKRKMEKNLNNGEKE